MFHKNIKFMVLLAILIIIIISLLMKNSFAMGTTLVDTVKALNKGSSYSAGATSGVYYTNSHEYRYVGSNVNNYVKFNDDLYRIIGVFDNNTHGKSGEMVKLIRARSLRGLSWGNYNSSNTTGTYSGYANDWVGTSKSTSSNLNIILNEYFYNRIDVSSTYGACSNWTYFYNNNEYKTNNCTQIKGYGIKENVRNYIETVTWYLYGNNSSYSTSRTKQNWYLCERGGNSCISAGAGSYGKSVEAKIGLMYPSDYLYASSYYSSSDSTVQSSYYYGNNNWLYNGYEWTLTPNAARTDRVWRINDGYVSDNTASIPYSFRPTFYLKSSVYVTGGDGSFDNPYTLGCDDCA